MNDCYRTITDLDCLDKYCFPNIMVAYFQRFLPIGIKQFSRGNRTICFGYGNLRKIDE